MAAQTGSFTLAGEALHVTQGAVSRQVKLLETTLGVALFLREHQRVELTPAGRELAQSLQRLFAEMEQAVLRASVPAQRELLRVNLPPTFATRWLAPRLSDFRRLHEHLDLQITTERLQQPRDAQPFDCVVLFGDQPWPRQPCEPLLYEHHVLVSSPRLWKRGQPPPLERSTLLHVLDGGERLPVWERWIEAHGPNALDPRPGLNFSTLDQAINAAVSGAGVVVVDAAMIVRELQEGTLMPHSALFLDGPCGYWMLRTATDPQRQVSVTAFADWLLGQCRSAHSPMPETAKS